jgi:transposase
VREFVASLVDQIHLEYLPAYAPELNPVEYIWGYCKQHELPNRSRNVENSGAR